MRTNIVALLAITATVLNLVRYLPQAYKSIREGFDGLSLHSWVLGLLEITAWALWAIFAQQWLAGVSYFLLTPLTAWFVAMIWLTQRKGNGSSHTTGLEDDIPIP